MKRIVDLRGGPKKLMKEAPHLVPSLVIYLLYVASVFQAAFNISLR